ncbi:MAG: protein phosphatase 2C domain-containing protein [Candidatus Bathyarchaeia archaeon]
MQKLGNEPYENEDSFCYDLGKGKFAIADGATECCFSKLWATILTRHFVESDFSLFSLKKFVKNDVLKALLSFLYTSQRIWINEIDWTSLKWNVLEKAKKGAFASFLGFEMVREEEYCQWRAISIGDCCLIHFRSRQLVNSFPLRDSSEFGNKPEMLPSIALPNIRFRVNYRRGKMRRGENIILATDAVAEWILREGKMISICETISSLKEEELRDFFRRLIEDGRMRNDDITLLILTFM